MIVKTTGIPTMTATLQMISVTGATNADVLRGSTSVDTLKGEVGNDTITGNAGVDTLSGGVGDDTFNLDDGVTLIKNPTEQAVIADIKAMRSAGRKLKQIADALTLRGIPNKTGKRRWTPQAVARILARNG